MLKVLQTITKKISAFLLPLIWKTICVDVCNALNVGAFYVDSQNVETNDTLICKSMCSPIFKRY